MLPEPKKPPFYTTGAFAILVCLMVLLIFLGAGIIALTRGQGPNSNTTPAISTVVGLFGPTIALLLVILRQQFNISQIEDHLVSHEELQQEVQKVANGNGPASSPPPPPAGPAGPAAGAS